MTRPRRLRLRTKTKRSSHFSVNRIKRNSRLENSLIQFLSFSFLPFPFLSFPFLSFPFLPYPTYVTSTYSPILNSKSKFSVVRFLTWGRVLLPTFISATSSPSHFVAESTFGHHCSKRNVGKSSFPWPDLDPDLDLDLDLDLDPEPDAIFNSPSPGVLCNHQIERGSSSLSPVIQGQSSLAKFTSPLQFNISRLRLVLASGGSPMRDSHDTGNLS